MSRESGIAIAAAVLAVCLGLLAYASGMLEPREPDISGALEWLSAEDGHVASSARSQTIATRALPTKQCVEALKAFTQEYPDLEAAWIKRPDVQSVSFPGAGDNGATIKVECSRVRQTLTISQHWE